MKNLLIVFAALALALSCSRDKDPHAVWTYDSVVYEMNVRQYTPEGTLAAARNELPRLKELGVDIVWLMPIYEIGVKARKGSLGSYYAIRDYTSVNHEFGTLEDFDSFVREAHRLGLKVVLDWVANHTSPDCPWVDEKPADWYVRDSLGNTIVEYDWTDIAKLNYDNARMREAVVDAMRFWLDRDIDGFRCDMAYIVPRDFWETAIPKLRSEYAPKGLYFLAEGEEPWLHEAGFDATYAWKVHHLLNDIARGKAGVKELKEYVAEDAARFPGDAFRLMFTSNHDENSWAGSEFKRMGDAAHLMSVLTFTLPQSQPLVYTAQEIGYDHEFAFFEKDSVTDWTDNAHTAFYTSLIRLRHSHPALRPGEKGGDYAFVDEPWVPENVFAFTRTYAGDTLLVLANLSGQDIFCTVPDAHLLKDAFTGEPSENQSLAPWGWQVLTK